MLLPISRNNGNFYAGIKKMWAIECHNVTGVMFDNQGKIIGIDKTDDWSPIEFERNTGFLIQEKKIAGRNSVVTIQKIYFEQNDIVQESLEQLKKLNACGCLNVVIEDNNGSFHYCGISKTDDDSTWYHQDMRTSDGFANTHAQGDEIGSYLSESMQCVTYNYAPFTNNPITLPPTADLIYYAGGFAFVTSPNTVMTLR